MKSTLEKLAGFAPDATRDIRIMNLSVGDHEATWKFDTLEEFLGAYKPGIDNASLHVSTSNDKSMWLNFQGKVFPGTTVNVRSPSRIEIETIFNIFEENYSSSELPVEAVEAEVIEPPVVFIGHGGSGVWRDLKDHLQDKHGYDVRAYEIGSRSGHSIRDILEEMLEESSCALLALTGEDETRDGKLLARQNVVHETGLFQGRLGFSRAIVLKEEGTEEFSNIAGVQQIRFSKGNIKETFGDVLAVLKREFGNKPSSALPRSHRVITHQLEAILKKAGLF